MLLLDQCAWCNEVNPASMTQFANEEILRLYRIPREVNGKF